MYYDRYQRQLAQLKGTVKTRAQPADVLQYEAEIYHPLHDDIAAAGTDITICQEAAEAAKAAL